MPFLKFWVCFWLLFFWYCASALQPNNPHDDQYLEGNVLHTVFSERPKHLDPVRAYSSDEYAIISQIYEPLYQYHYLKRPYELEPLTAVSMPKIIYRNQKGKVLDQDVLNQKIAKQVI